MWKDSIRNIVVIFQPNILRIVGFYVRHSAMIETSTFAVSEGISLLHKLVLWSERLLEYFVFFREARKPTLLHLAVVEYIPTFAYILHAK